MAVKILHPALETHDFIERFRSERQVLAGFNHPNIARLFDGGRTEDGILYLVQTALILMALVYWVAAVFLGISAKGLARELGGVQR